MKDFSSVATSVAMVVSGVKKALSTLSRAVDRMMSILKSVFRIMVLF